MCGDTLGMCLCGRSSKLTGQLCSRCDRAHCPLPTSPLFWGIHPQQLSCASQASWGLWPWRERSICQGMVSTRTVLSGHTGAGDSPSMVFHPADVACLLLNHWNGEEDSYFWLSPYEQYSHPDSSHRAEIATAKLKLVLHTRRDAVTTSSPTCTEKSKIGFVSQLKIKILQSSPVSDWSCPLSLGHVGTGEWDLIDLKALKI